METEHVADGRKEGPRNLYEAMGYRKSLGFYKTDSAEEYNTQLRKMNLADLRAHCVTVGIRPSADRRQLEDKLRKEFKINTSSYRGAQKRPKKEIDPDKRSKALAIMRGANSL
jgi:hypothetical protein